MSENELTNSREGENNKIPSPALRAPSPRRGSGCHPEEGSKCVVEDRPYSGSQRNLYEKEMLNVVQPLTKITTLLQHDNIMLLKKKVAFTLAEVLVTLSILGVVAAISIPNMVQQYQKRVTITKLQKAYTVLEQAAQNMAINSGCVGQNVKCTGILDVSDARNIVNEKFIELSGLKVSKYYPYAKSREQSFSCIKNSSCTSSPGGYLRYFSTPDNIGFFIMKAVVRTNASQAGSKFNTQNGLLVVVFTDAKYASSKITVNGKDIFRFVITENFDVEPLVYGFGYSIWAASATQNGGNNWISENDIGCNGSDGGSNCAAKIIKDGWKITYW